MKIAIDYDGTFTADRKLFSEFIKLAQQAGHTVICVTMRYPSKQETISDMPCPIFYTERKSKLKYMAENGHTDINIWIDDMPFLI